MSSSRGRASGGGGERERMRVTCLYSVLGVAEGASEQDIRRAYRTLSLRYHPDKNPENREEAEERFKEIAEAYSVLSDPQSRAEYDDGRRYGMDGRGRARGGGGGFDERFRFHHHHDIDPFAIFEEFFRAASGGGSRRGERRSRGSSSGGPTSMMDAFFGGGVDPFFGRGGGGMGGFMGGTLTQMPVPFRVVYIYIYIHVCVYVGLNQCSVRVAITKTTIACILPSVELTTDVFPLLVSYYLCGMYMCFFTFIARCEQEASSMI